VNGAPPIVKAPDCLGLYRLRLVPGKFCASPKGAPTLTLRLCGEVSLKTEHTTAVEPPLGAKPVALLAFLVLEGRRPHRREALTALLWSEYPDDNARASLRQALSHLRDALGEALNVDRATVELSEPPVCDVVEFTRLAAADPASALAIDIPSFLSNLTIRICPVFEEWADAKRRDLLDAYRAVARDRAGDAIARRAWRDADALAERWVAVDAFSDDAVAALVEARFMKGDREGALAIYRRHAEHLRSEADRAPSKSLAALASRLEASTQTRPAARVTTYRREVAPRLDASLVGREHEWTALKDAWHSVETSGVSRVVLIEGDPGMGKTRIADDFMRSVTTRGGIVFRGRGYDAKSGAPLGAAIEVLRSALDAPGLAGVDPDWLADVSRVLPELRRRFPGLPDKSGQASIADGWRLFEAIAQVFLAIVDENPIAVLIDDLQWCDADSCGLLHFLLRRLSDVRVLWCATFTVGELERDSPASRLSRALRSTPRAEVVQLAPLSEREVSCLIRDAGHLRDETSTRALASHIHDVTGGNPFYVMELLRTMFTQRLLTADASTGEWTIQPSAESSVADRAVAPTVHEVIFGRIDSLEPEVYAVLVSITVAGSGCRADVLSHLHGISRLHAAILGDALVERRLAVEENGVYRCAHPAIASVVSARLTGSRRHEVERALEMAADVLGGLKIPNVGYRSEADYREQPGMGDGRGATANNDAVIR
jgi:DNA-binding SARP family transcriptional activator